MAALPPLHSVHVAYRQPTVDDPRAAARSAVLHTPGAKEWAAGARTAALVGSRGIAQYAELVAGTVEALRELGAEPFLVPAMGSHGGGDGPGQRQTLERLGITEALAPIVSERGVVQLGTNEFGAPVFAARAAATADAVVAVHRIKGHTSFAGPYESGLAKLLAVGLGQAEGAAAAHAHGPQRLAELVPASARVALAALPFRLGVAVVENASRRPGLVLAVSAERLLDDEPALLQQAKAWAAKLPFAAADVLVVGELGKNFSGVGMDPAVIGRRLVECEPDHPSPRIVRIAALGLAPESGGNALGVGLADLITERLRDAIDVPALRTNALAANLLQRARLPLTVEHDLQAVETALATCWQPDPAAVRLALIPNTLELTHLYVTPALAAELVAPADATLDIGPAMPWRWTDHGQQLDLPALFPAALCGRRAEPA